MSARYPSPAPLPSPPTEPPNSSAPIAPAQSANRTTSSLHPMSILSLITTDLPETPPDSRGSSSETNHLLVPPPESITSPVNDSALTLTDTEALTAAEQLYSIRCQNDANEHHESIATPAEDESLNAALIDSPIATVKDKGKGKDPELYDISLPQDGNSRDCQSVRSATHNEAENGLQVPAITDEIDLAFVLLDLSANRYECNTCLDGDPTVCSQCATVPWRQRAHPDSPVSPSPVVKYETNPYSSDSEDEGAPLSTARPVSPSPVVNYEPNLYSSDSEDEGAPLSTAHKIRFDPSCHGNCLQLSAHEGNAVIDLLTHRKQTHDSRHHGLEGSNGETRCPRCELVQAHIYVRYEQHYKVREYSRFERGDTVPLDDDTVAEMHGAAEHYGSKNYSVISSSNPPKLSRKTIKRLKAEKSAWKPEPNPLISTASDTPVSVTNVVERTSLPRSTKRPATRSSVTATTSFDPEALLEQTASKSLPPSDNQPPKTRPTYANRQSSACYPLATNYIDLATSISSPSSSSPSTPRQPQQNSKPFTSSPLKHALTAADWEQQQHTPTPLPTTTTTMATTTKNNNNEKAVLIGAPPSDPHNQRGNGRKTIKYFPPSPVKYIYGSVGQADEEEKQEDKANSIPLPLTPPSSSRKRKAAAMQTAAIQPLRGEVQGQESGEEEVQVEWYGKKFKGRAVLSMSVERERMRDVLDALGAVGG